MKVLCNLTQEAFEKVRMLVRRLLGNISGPGQAHCLAMSKMVPWQKKSDFMADYLAVF